MRIERGVSVLWHLTVLGLALCAVGCPGGGGVTNPVPSVTSMSPTSAPAAGPGFTLNVNGSGFVSGSIVRWNGSDRATTFINSTQLTAVISATDVAAVGNAQVTVFNPAPGGGTSGALTFTITNPVPTISSLSPSSAVAGSPPITLTVNGSNFLSGLSVVRWNGSDRPTTFVSSTQLTAAIPASDLAAAGSAQVTVFNPAPGGGTSGTLTFTITNPVPTISSLSPSSAVAGSPPITLTVNGSNFLSGLSVVRWNGSDRPTTFVSSTQLTAGIPASDLAAAGSAQVTVFNPVPGGGTSNAATFTINVFTSNPVPSLLSVSPSGVTAELTGFTLTVSGSGFVSGSVAQWNGSSRATTVLSSTQLRVAPLPGDTASAGTAQVTVLNPSPGGGTSNSLSFLVSALPAGAVGVTDRLSVASDSSEADGDSFALAISSDGRFIAFDSFATNLVPGDTNGAWDVFLRDTCRGAAAGCTPSTTRVSVASDGSQANGDSFSPSISADGRFVAFRSVADNLVSSDTNLVEDIFVRDTCAGATGCTPSTVRVSTATGGSQSNGDSFNFSISADGRLVAFESFATNLVASDTNGVDDIFVRDTCAGATGCTVSTTRVSVDTGGAQANDASFLPAISGNGRFVVFTSFANNLVPNDTNGGHDVFVRDTCFGVSTGCTASTSRVSVDSSGNQADAPSGGPATGGASISADGRFVAFGSRATNLVSGDTNGWFDVFVRDTCAGATGCTPSTIRVSVALDGTQSDQRSDLPLITSDGRFVVFVSYGDQFLPGDNNLASDVFFARTGRP